MVPVGDLQGTELEKDNTRVLFVLLSLSSDSRRLSSAEEKVTSGAREVFR